MATIRLLKIGLGFVIMLGGFRFLRTSDKPNLSEDKMFDTNCIPENKCIDSLIEFKQDPGSCSSPIGRQMNEPNRIQRTDIFFISSEWFVNPW